jgi:surfeit locus 1 family protein
VKRSTILFLIVAVVLAGGCIRLGIWQLDRREQRRAMNAQIRQRMLAPARSVETADRDTAKTRFSIVAVRGVPDYSNEIVLTHRGNAGSPGVDILTPIRLPGQDTAVLVNRGWAYSPDGVTIDLSRWHETGTAFTGYVESFVSAPLDTVRARAIRRSSYEAISRVIPYPIHPFFVVALGDSVTMADSSPGRPALVRLRAPKLDEGPHLSYAFQWFGFATIALVGAGIVTARSMQSRV